MYLVTGYYLAELVRISEELDQKLVWVRIGQNFRRIGSEFSLDHVSTLFGVRLMTRSVTQNSETQNLGANNVRELVSIRGASLKNVNQSDSDSDSDSESESESE